MTKIYISMLALCCAMTLSANEMTGEKVNNQNGQTPSIEQDTVIIDGDTILRHRHPQPIYLDMRPARKAAASSCVTDSIIGLDPQGNYVSKIVSTYDDAGNVITYAKYSWTGGTMKGVERYKQTYSGSTIVMQVNYDWKNNTWVERDSMQLLFYTEGTHKGWQSRDEKYLWDATTNKWRCNTLYEYEYDDRFAGDYQTLSRYSVAQQSAGVWNWVYDNKSTWTFDDKKRETCNTYETYDSSTGKWIGSTKNVTGYDAAGNINLTEVYSGWENNDWKGSKRNWYIFSGTNWILQTIYKWTTGGWAKNYTYTKKYDGANVIDDATYYWATSDSIGTTRTSKVYYPKGKEDSVIVWKWDNEWVKNTLAKYPLSSNTGKDTTLINSVWNGTAWDFVSQSISTLDGKKRAVLVETQAWNGSAWKDSLQIRHAFNASGTDTLVITEEKIGEAWSATDSVTHVYEYVTVAGQKKTKSETQMTWTKKSGVWKGNSRTTNSYDEGGNVILKDTWTWKDNDWVNNVRREYAYKNNNSKYKTMESYKTYNSSKHVWTGTTKTENDYDDNGTKVMTASYKWNANHTAEGDWEGLSKSLDVYENGVKTSTYSYKWDQTAWNWTGMFRNDYTRTGSKVTDQMQYRYDGTKYVYDTHYSYIYDTKHSDPIISQTEIWVPDQNSWCNSYSKEIRYDNTSAGRKRFEREIKYSSCNMTTYDYKRYYYSCDQYFAIRFVNYDGAKLDSMSVLEGDMPSYDFNAKGTPTRESDKQNTYSFNGWDKDVYAATGDETYTAVYDADPIYYTIRFYNDDNTLFSVKTAKYGETLTCDEPVKTSDARYTYKFLGWGNGVKPVTGDTSYVAVYSSTLNQYTVTFYDEDSTTVIESKKWDYGATPTCAEPTKPATEQYTFAFAGWSTPVVAVTGETGYKATYSSTVNKYQVTFYDEDGTTVLDSKEVAYGDMPEYSGTEPTKPKDDEYTYQFKGWKPEIVTVTGNATYTAKFESIVNQYTATFVAGPIEHPVTVDYGTETAGLLDALWEYAQTKGVTKNGNGEYQYNDGTYLYTFLNWTPAIPETITGNQKFTANWKKELYKPTSLEAVESKTPAVKVIENGVMYILRDGKKYLLTGESME